jgi:hypothetical protein
MWDVPAVVNWPSNSVENVTLNTSWAKALDLSTVCSSFHSHSVNIKSGSPPCEANKLPSGLKCTGY